MCFKSLLLKTENSDKEEKDISKVCDNKSEKLF